MATSDTLNSLTTSSLAKCPTLKGKDNYTEWEEIMRSNLLTSGCWDIVDGREIAPTIPVPFYTSRNRPAGVKMLRETEEEYARRNDDDTYVYSDDTCKDRVLEIKDQVAGYESHTRLREKAKNLIMDSITKNLWHQCLNKDDPPALWQELRNDYHKAGVPELGKELAIFQEISHITYPSPQNLLNALKTQHAKIQVTLKAEVFNPKYLSWRYTYEMNKFKPLFDIPLAKYDTLEEYPAPEEVKRALEAHLVNHAEIPKKPTVGKSSTQATAPLVNTNIVKPSKKRKREEKKLTGYSSLSRPKCLHCDKSHSGVCWVKFPEKMPQYVRDSIAKRQKTSDNTSR
jgi:hypothetical protein